MELGFTSMYENDGAEVVEMFSDIKELGVFTSMDMAAVDEDSPSGKADWDGILKRVLPYVDFFVPSVEELAYMIDKNRFYEWKERVAGRDITTVLDVEKVLSGTGAGDTSIAAFLQAIVTGHSSKECLQLATATGASCVAAYDALSGLKSFEELKEKIQNGWEKN